MLTGEVPFTGPDYHYQKEKKLYTPISLLVVGLPKGLDNVISKLLEPNPNDRYHSVEEFIKEFNSL
jgi:serine/threonine protein kinase